MVLFLCITANKILIVGGSSILETEVIDLENLQLNCEKFGDLPHVRNDAVGAYISGNVVVCGSSTGNDKNNCKVLDVNFGSGYNHVVMYNNGYGSTRFHAASVSLTEHTMWVTGGYNPDYSEALDTSFITNGLYMHIGKFPPSSW